MLVSTGMDREQQQDQSSTDILSGTYINRYIIYNSVHVPDVNSEAETTG